MSFTSITFILLFLPCFLLLYYLIKKVFPKSRNIFLLVASFLFYAWIDVKFFFIFLLSLVINYFAAFFLNQKWSRPKFKLLFFIGIIGLNIFLLIYFKYFNFFISGLNRFLFPRLGLNSILLEQIALPLAISFYTFQQISYLADVFKGEKASRNFIEYALFISLFPKLIAGPLVRYHEFLPQIRERKENINEIFDGLFRFCIGLFQKSIIANILGEFIGTPFQSSPGDASLIGIWFITLTYALQIFFDFAGYTNMAIGIGKMIGFNFPENFQRPYLSQSITEFWRRWHITLGQFLRDYIYIPLGGNRVLKWRNILNFLIVFGIGGLWHGAGLHFLVWGLYYGFLLAGEKHFYGKLLKKLPSILQTIITFILVMISWVIFSAHSLSIALQTIFKMFIPGSLPFVIKIGDKRFLFIFALALILTFFPRIPKLNSLFQKATLLRGFIIIFLLLISVIFISSGSFQAFIYEQF